MLRYFSPALLLASAVYSVVAVLMFLFVFGPFVASHQIVSAIVFAVIVTLPYGALLLVHRLSQDRVSDMVVAVVTTVVVIISAVIYSPSFGPNDGEYVIAYVVVPILQGILVLAALIVVTWRRRRYGTRAA